jgi:hypothetical protein
MSYTIVNGVVVPVMSQSDVDQAKEDIRDSHT